MTRTNPSLVWREGDIAFIRTSQGNVATIDASDIPLVTGFAWQCITNGPNSYAVRRYRDGRVIRTESLHRMLVNAPDGMVVDHADGNGLNNRRANLRVCNKAENSANQPTTSSAGTTGVYIPANGRYEVRISKEGKRFYLGRFDTIEEASAAYRNARQDVRPEFYTRKPTQIRTG